MGQSGNEFVLGPAERGYCCCWRRHDVSAQNRHAVCIGFYSVSYTRSVFCTVPSLFVCVQFLVSATSGILGICGASLHSDVAYTEIYGVSRVFAFVCLHFLVFAISGFPFIRVLNITKFTVVPLFRRLFAGVQLGIERPYGRNLLMHGVHCDVGKGDLLRCRWVWAPGMGGGRGWGGGDSSVTELRWKDLIPSLFRVSCLRISSPSTFADTYRFI